MTFVLLAGAVAGLGVLSLYMVLDQSAGSPASQLARLDTQRQRSRRDATMVSDRRHLDESVRLRKFGSQIDGAMRSRGISLPRSVQADLAVMGRSSEAHLGMSVLAGVAGLVAPFIVLLPAVFLLGWSISIPVWVAGIGAVGGAVLATAQLSSEATERRRDFRHVVSAYLDLVSMNLAGGRGVPEALSSASALSDGWAMVRIRDTIESARLQGVTPWAALGELGDAMAVKELRDLAAALALVAEDGAKVRESLSARASSMRQRELAEAEGRAEKQSQSMLVAQLLLAVGFLIFLVYPALSKIVGI